MVESVRNLSGDEFSGFVRNELAFDARMSVTDDVARNVTLGIAQFIVQRLRDARHRRGEDEHERKELPQRHFSKSFIEGKFKLVHFFSSKTICRFFCVPVFESEIEIHLGTWCENNSIVQRWERH